MNPPFWENKVEKDQGHEVILTHRKNAGMNHNFTVNGNKLTLVAEDFVEALRNYINTLYSDDIYNNMVAWFQKHPPIISLSKDTLVKDDDSADG
ncbi:hypothetical protein [Candidatus Igneacidithiobacillus taiwanensis]|uniref:hypothetical protein n=1 Tax=Candidatus Igneacidithiobacillus taiwanensis TaxID=1945924 RepID=UPI0028982C3E|nr:hypothetical protein [Candidatus Igneacidithiobacillus taiwanensis]